MDWMEIFSLVTGLLYIWLEIRQKNIMWIVGLITSAATMWVFFDGGLYASAALNLYYVVISLWGLRQWRRDSRKTETEDAIHLNRLTLKTALLSAVIYAAGTAGLWWLMDLLEDPMSLMDAGITMLGAVATWWLSRSYKEQWILWIVANFLTFVMCLTQKMPYMSVLYVVYTAGAVFGYFHWRRNGQYVKDVN